jgi:hypothetical protein
MEKHILVDEYLDHLNYVDEVVPLAAVGIGLSAVSILQHGFKIYKDYFTKAARQCGTLPPEEKALCMLKARITAKNLQLQKLKQNMAKCQKAKNPEKCKEKVSGRMMKISDQIKFFSNRFKEIKKQAYQKQ